MDRLCFYSNSASQPPGRGARECVADPAIYQSLAKIRDWRRVLSNFHVAPFEYKGLRWNTIEHAFQAEKLGLANPDLRFQLSIDSGSAVGLGDGAEARKKRKWAILSADALRQWNAMSRGVIAEAKYAQCREARETLLATGNAQLFHIVPRSRDLEHFDHLEAIRTALAIVL